MHPHHRGGSRTASRDRFSAKTVPRKTSCGLQENRPGGARLLPLQRTGSTNTKFKISECVGDVCLVDALFQRTPKRFCEISGIAFLPCQHSNCTEVEIKVSIFRSHSGLARPLPGEPFAVSVPISLLSENFAAFLHGWQAATSPRRDAGAGFTAVFKLLHRLATSILAFFFSPNQKKSRWRERNELPPEASRSCLIPALLVKECLEVTS